MVIETPASTTSLNSYATGYLANSQNNKYLGFQKSRFN